MENNYKNSVGAMLARIEIMDTKVRTVLVQYWPSIGIQFLEIMENKSKTGVATMLPKFWD
jgi:hypothetical protein